MRKSTSKPKPVPIGKECDQKPPTEVQALRQRHQMGIEGLTPSVPHSIPKR